MSIIGQYFNSNALLKQPRLGDTSLSTKVADLHRRFSFTSQLKQFVAVRIFRRNYSIRVVNGLKKTSSGSVQGFKALGGFEVKD